MINEHSIIKTSDKILREAIYKVFNGKCFYTGNNILFKNMHIDHILPVSKGGESCISNYVLSSGYINFKKNNKTNNNFVNVITEINNLLFVKKVVCEYNNIKPVYDYKLFKENYIPHKQSSLIQQQYNEILQKVKSRWVGDNADFINISRAKASRVLTGKQFDLLTLAEMAIFVGININLIIKKHELFIEN